MQQGIAVDASAAAPRADTGARTDDEQPRVHEVAKRLGTEFGDVAPERVEELVANAFGRFSDAPVRDFIGVLVERAVRGQLRAECDATSGGQAASSAA